MKSSNRGLTSAISSRGIRHAFWNAGEEPARVLEIITPGGFEDYFAALGELLAGGAPPDPAQQKKIIEHFGLDMDRDSIPRLAAEHGLRLPWPYGQAGMLPLNVPDAYRLRMSIGRSRRLVGRDRELAALRDWLGAAPASGGVCLISGEPGVGKSRLAADALKLLPPDWLVVRGRATDRDRPVPFRAVAECLLAASRRRPLPDDPDTRAFSAVLGRLVPAWRHGEGTHEPVVVTAEAVLRVLRSLAAPAPAIVLVEDIQWADPETLAVLEYLADNARDEPVAVVATARSDSPSPGLTLARDLAGRRAAEIIELNRLDADDVAGMAGDCLDTAEVSAGIRAFLDKAAGLPFLIEELVVTAAREGVLVKHQGGWALAETPADLVPDSYRESVQPATCSARRPGRSYHPGGRRRWPVHRHRHAWARRRTWRC